MRYGDGDGWLDKIYHFSRQLVCTAELGVSVQTRTVINKSINIHLPTQSIQPIQHPTPTPFVADGDLLSTTSTTTTIIIKILKAHKTHHMVLPSRPPFTTLLILPTSPKTKTRFFTGIPIQIRAEHDTLRRDDAP